MKNTITTATKQTRSFAFLRNYGWFFFENTMTWAFKYYDNANYTDAELNTIYFEECKGNHEMFCNLFKNQDYKGIYAKQIN